MLIVASSQHSLLQLVNTSLVQIESFLSQYLHFSLFLQNHKSHQIDIHELLQASQKSLLYIYLNIHFQTVPLPFSYLSFLPFLQVL